MISTASILPTVVAALAAVALSAGYEGFALFLGLGSLIVAISAAAAQISGPISRARE